MANPRTRNELARLVAATLSVTALLAGCTAGDTTTGSSTELSTDSADLLHPTGDTGAWFDNAYAGGVDSVYSTSATLCGLSDDVSVEQLDGPQYDTRVQGRNLATGKVLWEVADGKCQPGAATGDVALVVSNYVTDPEWSLIDIASGQVVQTLDTPSTTATASVISFAGDRLITNESRSIAAYDAGAEVWRTPVGVTSDITVLGDDMLGVFDSANKQLTVIDSRTGEQRSRATNVETGSYTWASDGYRLKVNERDPEYAFYDLDGTEVDRTVGDSQYGFVPKPEQGVTFTIQDQLDANTVVGVSADGTPSLYEGTNRQNFTQVGEIELPDSILSVKALSADGSLLLMNLSQEDRIVALDGAGHTVWDWAATSNTSVRVEHGYIVLEQGNNTTVLLPA